MTWYRPKSMKPPAVLYVVVSPRGDYKYTTQYKIIARWHKQRGDKLFKYTWTPTKKRKKAVGGVSKRPVVSAPSDGR